MKSHITLKKLALSLIILLLVGICPITSSACEEAHSPLLMDILKNQFRKSNDCHEQIPDYSTLVSKYNDDLSDMLPSNSLSTEQEPDSPVSLAASSNYYLGSSVPTYTYITGRSLLYQSSLDLSVGTVKQYTYYRDNSEAAEYLATLKVYYDFVQNSKDVADDSSCVIYGLYNYEAILLVEVNFATDRVNVILFIPTTSVSITSNKTVTIGDVFTLSATTYPSYATDKNVTWSSSNTSVATVSSAGKVTTKKVGNATITVRSKTQDSAYDSCFVTVNPKPVSVTGIRLNLSNATVSVGKTLQLTATVLPSNADDKTVTWSSVNPAVATVNNGVITGVEEGSTIITARTQDGDKTASCIVTVKYRPDITNFLSVTNGDSISVSLSVSYYPEDTKAYIATYDKNGELINLNLPQLRNGLVETTVPRATNVSTMKVFLWRGNSMKALATASKRIN